MRAPQYGHTKGKKRGKQAPQPAVACPLPGRGLWRAVGLHGPNEPLPTRRIAYKAPRTVQYEDGTWGAPVTLHLHHKSAVWEDGKKVSGEGPVVSKRYLAGKTSPRE